MPDKKDPKPTKFAKPKDKDGVKFADPTSKGDLSTGSSKKSVSTGKSKSLKGKKAQKGGALNVDGSDGMRQFMDITQGARDRIAVPTADTDSATDDDENVATVAGAPDPDVTDNLPARTSMDPTEYDPGSSDEGAPIIDINWHDVKDLPGYHIEQVRAVFRPLLNSLMGNQLEDLRLAATTDGSNTKAAMKQAIGFISHNGTQVDDANLEIPGMPDYVVNRAVVYHLDDRVYIVAKENYQGQTNYYIYEGEQKNGIGADHDYNAPRLN